MNAKIKLGTLPSGERIEWHIVSTTDTEISLLSVQGLINRPLSVDFRRCVYDNSDLKLWMENAFLGECFKESEMNSVKSVRIPDEESITRWFSTEYARRCKPSQYALDNGAATFRCTDNQETCAYWLSDSGRKHGYSSSIVLGNGKIYRSAYNGCDHICVRVVMVLERGLFDEYHRNNFR